MRKYQLSCWSSALLSLVIIVGICDGKGVPIYSRSGSRKYINCEKKNRSKSQENVNKKKECTLIKLHSITACFIA